MLVRRMVRCPPGAYAAVPGASECTLCPINSFADTYRSQACTPCGEIGDNLLTLGNGSTTASDCVCSAGFYSLGVVTRQTKQPCLVCDKTVMSCQSSTSKWRVDPCWSPLRQGRETSHLLCTYIIGAICTHLTLHPLACTPHPVEQT
jgi:hypothetical protein